MADVNRMPSLEMVLLALHKNHAFINRTAKELGVSCGYLSKRIKNSVKLKAAYEEIREQWVDRAEESMMTLIDSFNPQMVMFYLKCKGGYIENPQALNRSEEIAENITKIMAELAGRLPD